jgi:hypothetical protein
LERRLEHEKALAENQKQQEQFWRGKINNNKIAQACYNQIQWTTYGPAKILGTV